MLNLGFDPKVRLGDILLILTFVIGFAVSWARMDSRLTLVERTAEQNRAIIAQQQKIQQDTALTLQEMRTLLSIYIPSFQKLRQQVQEEHGP